MKSPRFFLGATLLFWGWQTDMLLLGALMALVIESTWLIHWRWNFSDKDFNRIADLCALIFMVILGYRFAMDRSSSTLLDLLQIMPIPFFPLLACQHYGAIGGVDTSALFYSSRQRRRENPNLPRNVLDISLPYALACVLSASAANARATFFVGFLVLSVWALWKTRPRRFGLKVWIPLMIVAIGAGYASQHGLKNLQTMVEQAVLDWYESSHETKEDAYKTLTSLGEMGRLKLSHHIVIRILSKPGDFVPGLLRSAAYNSYFSGNWVARDASFAPVAHDHVRDLWFYGEAPDFSREITMSMYLKDGTGLLSLPHGAYEIQGMKARNLERNPYGAVVVDLAPDLAVFSVKYGDSAGRIKPPGPEDLRIPVEIASAISLQVRSLDLPGKTPREKIRAIQGYFFPRFKYSLELLDKGDRETALERFLLDTKKGHCEYFATATVLLLREAGVPARYATGFAVMEAGPEGQWIVRARHAHAWALAYVDGKWVDIDTTPGEWAEEEKQGESHFQGLYDAVSNLWWRISMGRLEGPDTSQGVKDFLLLSLIPLLAFLAWRLFIKERVGTKNEGLKAASVFPGKDSEFYQIEKTLASRGYGRQPGENLSLWHDRLDRDYPGAMGPDTLRVIIGLHYQYRFDPLGLNKNDRQRLATLAKEWLDGYDKFFETGKERNNHADI
ncbi:MAG: transglutaminase domain-containing protein [Desulfatibacillum sp.]|nr:transglutaminase domain-containing protein [Desulfatibacillum sp.]